MIVVYQRFSGRLVGVTQWGVARRVSDRPSGIFAYPDEYHDPTVYTHIQACVNEIADLFSIDVHQPFYGRDVSVEDSLVLEFPSQ